MDDLKRTTAVPTPRTRLCRAGWLALALLASVAAVPAVQAGGLSVGLGGLGEVSVGRGGLARADLGVGGLDVEAGVLERDSLARGCVGRCDGTGTSVGVSVGSGGVTASVGTGGGSTGGGSTGGGSTGGTPGGTPAVPGVGATRAATLPEAPPLRRKTAMACAGTGNSAVYDGYALVDRNGVTVGQVHDTRLSPDLRITGLRVQTAGKRCIGLEGGTYRVLADGRVWVNMDAARLR